MSGAATVPHRSYETAGREAVTALRGYSVMLVVSDQLPDAAEAALGIARAEGAHRKVTIVDLGGDVAPLMQVVSGNDPHGIYDSFEFGTSLSRIARAVEGEPNLHIVRSGTLPPAVGEIFSASRWERIAADFSARDEMLLLVAHSDAPALDALAGRVDGLVLVGVTRASGAPEAKILLRIPAVRRDTPPAKAASIPRPTPAARPLTPARALPVAAGILVLGVVGALLYPRMRADAPPQVSAPVSDSLPATAAPRYESAIAVANPQDSSGAAEFSVEILAANTAEGANFELQRHGTVMPAATIAAVPIGDTEAIWYKVYAGAYSDSAEAEQLLARLRRMRVVPESAGAVVRTPLAHRVDSVTSEAGSGARLRAKLEEYQANSIPVYGLIQPDGSARVYSGAFQSPDQSSHAATALRVAGLVPVLEYRTGRMP